MLDVHTREVFQDIACRRHGSCALFLGTRNCRCTDGLTRSELLTLAGSLPNIYRRHFIILLFKCRQTDCWQERKKQGKFVPSHSDWNEPTIHQLFIVNTCDFIPHHGDRCFHRSYSPSPSQQVRDDKRTLSLREQSVLRVIGKLIVNKKFTFKRNNTDLHPRCDVRQCHRCSQSLWIRLINSITGSLLRGGINSGQPLLLWWVGHVASILCPLNLVRCHKHFAVLCYEM